MNERKEGWMRIPVFIISGVIFWVWGYLIYVLLFVNFIYTIFTKKRLKELAEMSEIWNTQIYVFFRYATFVTNDRPFPFKNLTKNISKFKK